MHPGERHLLLTDNLLRGKVPPLTLSTGRCLSGTPCMAVIDYQNLIGNALQKAKSVKEREIETSAPIGGPDQEGILRAEPRSKNGFKIFV